jgi:ATP-dependent DNA ligase
VALLSLVVEAVNNLKLRCCLIDGEVVCCDERGVAAFHVLRHRRNESQAFLYAFDLLELNGKDMRREPYAVRKATLACYSRPARATDQRALDYPGDLVFATPAGWASKASCPNAQGRTIEAAGPGTG